MTTTCSIGVRLARALEGARTWAVAQTASTRPTPATLAGRLIDPPSLHGRPVLIQDSWPGMPAILQDGKRSDGRMDRQGAFVCREDGRLLERLALDPEAPDRPRGLH